MSAPLIDNEVALFLMGQKPLEGVWFNERHPTRPGMYWWRKVIRERAEARKTGGPA
jgi:hypothetical protein